MPVQLHAIFIFTHGKVNEEHVPVQLHAIFIPSKVNEEHVPVQFHAILTPGKVNGEHMPLQFLSITLMKKQMKNMCLYDAMLSLLRVK